MIDLIVIGAGSAGLAAAKRAAQAGKKVVLVENDTIGGTCVSYGCVPKKVWHAISLAKHQLDVAKENGWDISVKGFDWQNTQQRLSQFVTGLNKRHYEKCLKLGVEVIQGTANLVDPQMVEVNGKKIATKHILIAVGAKAERLEVPGSDFCDTSYEFFSWDKLPKSVLIWGGGYIAVELGSILNALGAKVHIVIRKTSILNGFDHDMCDFLQKRYIERGIEIHKENSIVAITKNKQQLNVELTNGLNITVNKVIQALGRKPNTDQLNCDEVGIARSKSKAIIVNDSFLTNIPTISAIGDCIDHVQLTPVAIAQGRQWVDAFYKNTSFPVDYRNIPTAVFSHPEAASIGFTEKEALEKFKKVQSKILTFNPLTLALTNASKEPVFMKLIFEGDNETVIGIHIVADAAAEMIQSLAVAVQKGITKADLDLTMALHPSLTEELVTLY